jgi:hypothetical protein
MKRHHLSRAKLDQIELYRSVGENVDFAAAKAATPARKVARPSSMRSLGREVTIDEPSGRMMRCHTTSARSSPRATMVSYLPMSREPWG